MTDLLEEINNTSKTKEPYPEEMDYCVRCDCEIYLPSAPDCLCPKCAAAREDGE